MELFFSIEDGLVNHVIKKLEEVSHLVEDKGSSAKAYFANELYEVTLEALPQTFITDGIDDFRQAFFHTAFDVEAFGLRLICLFGWFVRSFLFGRAFLVA
jgi:hypothetical protein